MTKLTLFRKLDVACGLRSAWDRELRLEEDRNRFHIRPDGDVIPRGSRAECPWASPSTSWTVWVLQDLYTGHLEVPQHLFPCCLRQERQIAESDARVARRQINSFSVNIPHLNQ